MPRKRRPGRDIQLSPFEIVLLTWIIIEVVVLLAIQGAFHPLSCTSCGGL